MDERVKYIGYWSYESAYGYTQFPLNIFDIDNCGDTCNADPSCIGALWRSYSGAGGACNILYQGGNNIPAYQFICGVGPTEAEAADDCLDNMGSGAVIWARCPSS